MRIPIRPLVEDDVPSFLAHYSRHCAESGVGEDGHFLAIDPKEDLSEEFNHEALLHGLEERAWRRWFVANEGERIIGHADLKGDALQSGMHRCEFGIGVERDYRGRGIGRKLMVMAIDFARTAGSIDWVDLRVFSHNIVAHRLYDSLGFQQVGAVVDRFRKNGLKIDDVLMTLNVSGGTQPEKERQPGEAGASAA